VRDLEFERQISPQIQGSSWYMGEYGSFYLASRYCGFAGCVRQCPGTWLHGWAPEYFNIHPEMVIGTHGQNIASAERQRVFVGRDDQREYLLKAGFPKTACVGLPICYTSDSGMERIGGSLLVVPVHSLSHTEHDWDFDEYADEVLRVAGRFTKVTVCVHASCVEKGYWTDAFSKRGVPWIVGASHGDVNTLQRVRDIFSRFEFVTTNGFGSHIAYAAAFGCRVSLWGPMAKWELSAYQNDTLYKNCPEATIRTMEFQGEEFLRRQYADLFTSPWEAETRVEWGQREIGWENRRSPAELKRIFGWDLRTRVIRGVAGRVKKLFR